MPDEKPNTKPRIVCPHCRAPFVLSETDTRRVMRQELLASEVKDYDSPIRELLFSFFNHGGIDKTVQMLWRTINSKKSTAPMKLRAMDMVLSAMKHFEKQTPPKTEIGDLDTEELKKHAATLLGLPVTEQDAAKGDERESPPEWYMRLPTNQSREEMEQNLAKGRLPKTKPSTEAIRASNKATEREVEAAVAALKDRYGKEAWFVDAVQHAEIPKAIMLMVKSHADVPAELANGERWEGFPVYCHVASV